MFNRCQTVGNEKGAIAKCLCQIQTHLSLGDGPKRWWLHLTPASVDFEELWAIATRCLCPPERAEPRSPTQVLALRQGHNKVVSIGDLAASTIWVASGRVSAIFSCGAIK